MKLIMLKLDSWFRKKPKSKKSIEIIFHCVLCRCKLVKSDLPDNKLRFLCPECGEWIVCAMRDGGLSRLYSKTSEAMGFPRRP